MMDQHATDEFFFAAIGHVQSNPNEGLLIAFMPDGRMKYRHVLSIPEFSGKEVPNIAEVLGKAMDEMFPQLGVPDIDRIYIFMSRQNESLLNIQAMRDKFTDLMTNPENNADGCNCAFRGIRIFPTDGVSWDKATSG